MHSSSNSVLFSKNNTLRGYGDSPDEQSLVSKLFIGSLPPNSRDKDIHKAFRGYGKISCVHLFKDFRSGLCKGFGDFVIEISNEEKLVHFLKQEFHIKGRKVYLERFLEGGRLKEKNEELHRKRICIKNLPRGITNAEIYGIFSQFGKVENAYQIKGVTGNSLPFGYVTFEREKSALACLDRGRVVLRDGVISCHVFKKRVINGNLGTSDGRASIDYEAKTPSEREGNDRSCEYEPLRRRKTQIRDKSCGREYNSRSKLLASRTDMAIQRSGRAPYNEPRHQQPRGRWNTSSSFVPEGVYNRKRSPRSWVNKRSRLMHDILNNFNKIPGDSVYDYCRVQERHIGGNIRFVRDVKN